MLQQWPPGPSSHSVPAPIIFENEDEDMADSSDVLAVGLDDAPAPIMFVDVDEDMLDSADVVLHGMVSIAGSIPAPVVFAGEDGDMLGSADVVHHGMVSIASSIPAPIIFEKEDEDMLDLTGAISHRMAAISNSVPVPIQRAKEDVDMLDSTDVASKGMEGAISHSVPTPIIFDKQDEDMPDSSDLIAVVSNDVPAPIMFGEAEKDMLDSTDIVSTISNNVSAPIIFAKQDEDILTSFTTPPLAPPSQALQLPLEIDADIEMDGSDLVRVLDFPAPEWDAVYNGIVIPAPITSREEQTDSKFPHTSQAPSILSDDSTTAPHVGFDFEGKVVGGDATGLMNMGTVSREFPPPVTFDTGEKYPMSTSLSPKIPIATDIPVIIESGAPITFLEWNLSSPGRRIRDFATSAWSLATAMTVPITFAPKSSPVLGSTDPSLSVVRSHSPVGSPYLPPILVNSNPEVPAVSVIYSVGQAPTASTPRLHDLMEIPQPPLVVPVDFDPTSVEFTAKDLQEDPVGKDESSNTAVPVTFAKDEKRPISIGPTLDVLYNMTAPVSFAPDTSSVEFPTGSENSRRPHDLVTIPQPPLVAPINFDRTSIEFMEEDAQESPVCEDKSVLVTFAEDEDYSVSIEPILDLLFDMTAPVTFGPDTSPAEFMAELKNQSPIDQGTVDFLPSVAEAVVPDTIRQPSPHGFTPQRPAGEGVEGASDPRCGHAKDAATAVFDPPYVFGMNEPGVSQHASQIFPAPLDLSFAPSSPHSRDHSWGQPSIIQANLARPPEPSILPPHYVQNPSQIQCDNNNPIHAPSLDQNMSCAVSGGDTNRADGMDYSFLSNPLPAPHMFVPPADAPSIISGGDEGDLGFIKDNGETNVETESPPDIGLGNLHSGSVQSNQRQFGRSHKNRGNRPRISDAVIRNTVLWAELVSPLIFDDLALPPDHNSAPKRTDTPPFPSANPIQGNEARPRPPKIILRPGVYDEDSDTGDGTSPESNFVHSSDEELDDDQDEDNEDEDNEDIAFFSHRNPDELDEEEDRHSPLFYPGTSEDEDGVKTPSDHPSMSHRSEWGSDKDGPSGNDSPMFDDPLLESYFREMLDSLPEAHVKRKDLAVLAHICAKSFAQLKRQPSPPVKTKSFSKRHRPAAKVILSRDVREHAFVLMKRTKILGQKVHPIKSATVEHVERYARTKNHKFGPTITDFQLDLSGTGIASLWNKRAAMLFTHDFLNSNKYECRDEVLINATFTTHLLQLKNQYRSYLQLEEAPPPPSRARDARRRSRRERRSEICDSFSSDIKMRGFAKVWEKIPWHGCSGDETDSRNVPHRHTITTLPWRAPEIRAWMQTFDDLHLHTRFVSGLRATPGNFPHIRVEPPNHGGWIERGTARVVKGLPINFYRQDWLDDLDDIDRHSLDAAPPMDLSFSPKIIR